MSDTASQRPQKLFRIKPVERNFFSFIFALTGSRGALLSPGGCDNVSGSDPSQAGQSSSLETFKINNTGSRQAA
jgi:hypothetical protein